MTQRVGHGTHSARSRPLVAMVVTARNAVFTMVVYELLSKFPAAHLTPARFPMPIRSSRFAYHSDASQCKRHVLMGSAYRY